MFDPRLQRLARLLVHYSIEVRPGQCILILAPEEAQPLLTLLIQEIEAADAEPVACVEDSPGEVDAAMPFDPVELQDADAVIFVEGDDRPAPSPVAANAEGGTAVDQFLRRAAGRTLRWATTLYPCATHAANAGLSLGAWEEFLYAACHVDEPDPAAYWQSVSANQAQLCQFLSQARAMRFTTPQGTDLRVQVAGRHWINSDGRCNLPDGEVFTGPHLEGTEGVVAVSFPAMHGSERLHDVRLEIVEGRVIKATAARGQAVLDELLAWDAGAATVGEIALGCNYGITRPTGHTLCDEKIGGTFHLALGAAYPESGATNQSNLHWDLVVDLRQGGRIEVDGEVISVDGRFLDPTWPQPIESST